MCGHHFNVATGNQNKSSKSIWSFSFVHMKRLVYSSLSRCIHKENFCLLQSLLSHCKNAIFSSFFGNYYIDQRFNLLINISISVQNSQNRTEVIQILCTYLQVSAFKHTQVLPSTGHILTHST